MTRSHGVPSRLTSRPAAASIAADGGSILVVGGSRRRDGARGLWGVEQQLGEHELDHERAEPGGGRCRRARTCPSRGRAHGLHPRGHRVLGVNAQSWVGGLGIPPEDQPGELERLQKEGFVAGILEQLEPTNGGSAKGLSIVEEFQTPEAASFELENQLKQLAKLGASAFAVSSIPKPTATRSTRASMSSSRAVLTTTTSARGGCRGRRIRPRPRPSPRRRKASTSAFTSSPEWTFVRGCEVSGTTGLRHPRRRGSLRRCRRASRPDRSARPSAGESVRGQMAVRSRATDSCRIIGNDESGVWTDVRPARLIEHDHSAAHEQRVRA